jgi:hypothetical protein
MQENASGAFPCHTRLFGNDLIINNIAALRLYGDIVFGVLSALCAPLR